MTAFFAKFPEIAINETRTIFVKGGSDIPDGEYGFIETYCEDTACDCRRVLIQVLSPQTPGKVWATINYGWESLEFYEKWFTNKDLAKECMGATLDPLNPQSKYAHKLLEIFNHIVLDKEYIERLKRHYSMFKGSSSTKRNRLKKQNRKAKKRRK